MFLSIFQISDENTLWTYVLFYCINATQNYGKLMSNKHTQPNVSENLQNIDKSSNQFTN